MPLKQHFIFKKKTYLFFIRSQQAMRPECLWFSTQSFNSIEALTTSLPYLVRNCFLFILYFLAFAMKLDRVDVTFSGILPVLRYSIVWSYSSSFISSTCGFEELREYNYLFSELFVFTELDELTSEPSLFFNDESSRSSLFFILKKTAFFLFFSHGTFQHMPIFTNFKK